MGIAQVLRDMEPPSPDPNLLVGPSTFDDAGVYRLEEHQALVQTLDFFPPLVDDPYQFGQIAAANALSDIYAMNGRPLTVMNIVAFPDDLLPLEILGAILQGAAERVRTAGAVIVGGHSVRDSEIKFGLSVTGLVDPREMLTNAGARPGDALILTKPLGTGFVTTAIKKDSCPPELAADTIESMIQLNEIGRDALRASGAGHGLTDITGFGLAGHAAEMADASNVTIVIDVGSLPSIRGVKPFVIPRYFTRASKTNRDYVRDRLEIASSVDPVGLELAFDAQTSGGLLISAVPERVNTLIEALENNGSAAAALIGHVEDRQGAIAVRFR